MAATQSFPLRAPNKIISNYHLRKGTASSSRLAATNKLLSTSSGFRRWKK
jgi:hypothetical protein